MPTMCLPCNLPISSNSLLCLKNERELLPTSTFIRMRIQSKREMTKCIPEDIEIHSNNYGDEYSFINSIHRSSNYFLYHLSIH